LELLEIVLIRLGVDAPVEVLEVVAGHVLAMLAELDREAVKRAGVQSGQEAFDDELGAEVESADLANHFRSQVSLGGSHAPIVNAEWIKRNGFALVSVCQSAANSTWRPDALTPAGWQIDC